MTTSTPTIPDLAPATDLSLPEYDERRLGNGLTVIAVYRPSVPLVEVRLRVPFPGAEVAVSSMLANTLFAGTADKSITDIAAELQTVGGGLSASIDSDRLLVAGNGLVDGLPKVLATMAEVLTGAAFPDDQVTTERERLADQISVARQQPGHLVQKALLTRMYRDHPYAVQTPEPEEVHAVTPQRLAEMHGRRVHPAGATLVIVGDIATTKALDAAEQALQDWNGTSEPAGLDPIPSLTAGPVTLVDRPGSVQSSLRMATIGVGRTHDDNAAQQLANLIFGGYFSSRLVANIRESKGYTYSPRSVVDHAQAGTAIIVSSDVATEVTAPALWEIWYELGRIAAIGPDTDELELARRYALGTLKLGTATQSGLASLASVLAGSGLRLNWLSHHARRLAEADVADVARVAARMFAPTGAVTVVLGDAERVRPPMATLAEVTAAP